MEAEQKVEDQPTTNKTRINIWLSKDAYNIINELGVLDSRSMSDVIREALRDYITKHVHRINGGSHG